MRWRFVKLVGTRIMNFHEVRVAAQILDEYLQVILMCDADSNEL